MPTRAHRHPSLIAAATRSVIEALESRRLMAGDPATVLALPYTLEFDRTRPGVVDKDGQGTGLTWVQPNNAGNEYQPSLIDLGPGEGLLKITSTGTAAAGGNFGADNTLSNGLQMQFNARSKAWTMQARLKGPLSFINAPAEQGGIMFGPDQENYVKLVAVATTSGVRLQFIDEQKIASGYRRQLNDVSLTNIGSFASIQTLDLILSGDPATRTVRAYYRINGDGLVKIAAELVLDADKGSAFFSDVGRAGLIVMHKNDADPVTVAFDRFEVTRGGPKVLRPDVTATRPANGATNIGRDSFIAADVFLPTPGAGINTNTLTSANVKLYRTSDGIDVSATLNTSAAGDAIVLQPGAALAPNTKYTFEVTSGLQDLAGQAFLPYTATFTTSASVGNADPSIAFDKVALPTAMQQSFSGVTMGPDNRLYATTLSGHIFRYDIADDGTLSEPTVITTIRKVNGGARFVTGLEFDPASTPDNLIAWVTHGQSAFTNATDWTGRISRLTGPNLEGYQDMVVGLPRSIRDHLTNQMKFGPDGKLYFTQGSNSAMGAPDNAWGLREEHALNSAVLVADPKALVRRRKDGFGPLNVKSAEGGTFDPFAPGMPLGLYATGLRNAYDLVWHSNGQLYVPTNGSAGGGATPGTPSAPFSTNRRIDFPSNGPFTGPDVPAIDRVNEAQDDFLFRVAQGGYYGHPNASRNEYVLNGGNPTAGVDPNEVAGYPVGTLPDRNYRGSAYTFGKNVSPNGAIEYRSAEFGGKLQGKLLVVRYSGGDDVVALNLDAQGNVTGAQTGITGLTHLVDPLDLIEDRRNGNMYVVEFGANRITLLRPGADEPTITLNTTRRVFNDVRGGEGSVTRNVRITNTGNTNLVIPAGGIKLSGVDAGQFDIITRPGLPLTLAPGKSATIGVSFDPSGSTSLGIKTATLDITSNDPNSPLRQVRLRGLATSGEGGSNEPSLQRVLDLWQIPVNVGDSDPTTVALDNPPVTPNDEVSLQRMVKAGAGPVTIEPLAVFGLESRPAMELGYYEPGTPTERTELFSIDTSEFQSVAPTALGSTTFDPGDKAFGFFAIWPGKKNADGTAREGFTEDALNFWETSPSLMHKVRFYPLKNPDGTVVPNAYVMAHEEAEGAGDNQDFVAIVRNVMPAPGAPELGLQNLAGAPYADRLVFNKINTVDPSVPNVYRDVNKVRVRNTGTKNLVLNSLATTGRFELVNPPAAGTVIAPGKFVDLTVRFTATSGAIHNGTLVLNTNDADESAKVIKLAGYWQTRPEGNREPTLPQLGQILGYGTVFVYGGQQLNTGGLNSRVGDEILSEYWKRADPAQPISVRQLAAFHTPGAQTTVRWHRKGSENATNLFTHEEADGQSLFPRADGMTEPAVATFAPGSSTFGFKIDDAWSDHTKNPQEVETPEKNYGHSIRFYPVRDREGQLVRNQYIMVMDYFGVNYDYNDNMYLITNVTPELLPPTPAGFNAYQNDSGVQLDWADNTNDDLLGYYVYRSNNGVGGFKRLNDEPLTDSEYLDTTITDGGKWYYRVLAVATGGGASTVASAATPAVA
ncbi:MAG: choice-of-anchor D domain-containing protein [Tepidisphaeraceae bacterium]